MSNAFDHLLEKYITHTITTEERVQLLRMIASGNYDEVLGNILLQQLQEESYAAPDEKELREKIYQQITMRRRRNHPKPALVRTLTSHWLRYVAILLLLLGIGIYFFLHYSPVRKPSTITTFPSTASSNDLMPGRNRALLTLADGSTIDLDSTGNGRIAEQSGVTIQKQDALLDYTTTNHSDTTPALQNKLATPRGGQYQLRLPDGTLVWLNAESSIIYPTAFTGNSRQVTITGEVYFEVAKNLKMPFSVSTGNTAIQVLGTSFNINAYPDEKTQKTTLISGSVRVLSNNQQVVLKPGEQAIVNNDIQKQGNIDTDKIIAWKNGAFSFSGLDLQEALRQIARWYDLDIIYEKGIPNIRLGGDMSRSLNLSDLLAGLKGADVHFRLEGGRRLIVSP